MIRSALMNVMTAAVLKAGRGLKRDLGEVENLQVSVKGPGDFVTAALGGDPLAAVRTQPDEVGGRGRHQCGHSSVAEPEDREPADQPPPERFGHRAGGYGLAPMAAHGSRSTDVR